MKNLLLSTAIGPGTHTGVLYNNGNLWMVGHIIHGVILNNPVSEVLGGKNNPHKYGITQYMMQVRLVTVTAINPNRGNKALRNYIMGVNSMRNDIMKERGISDSQWADLSKLAVNITGVESKNGTSFKYKIKNVTPDWMLHAILYGVRGKTMPISRGLSLIKVFPSLKLLNARYSKYGINDLTLKNSNFKLGQATVIKMDENRKSMKNNYTWKDGTPMTTEEANNIYWNRGRLTSGLNDKNDNSNSGVAYNNKYNNRKIIF